MTEQDKHDKLITLMSLCRERSMSICKDAGVDEHEIGLRNLSDMVWKALKPFVDHFEDISMVNGFEDKYSGQDPVEIIDLTLFKNGDEKTLIPYWIRLVSDHALLIKTPDFIFVRDYLGNVECFKEGRGDVYDDEIYRVYGDALQDIIMEVFVQDIHPSQISTDEHIERNENPMLAGDAHTGRIGV